MLSRAVYFFCVAVMCFASFVFYPKWQEQRTEATISWDVSGYYWYLPSIFIYKDLKHQAFKDSILAKYRPTDMDFQQGMRLDNGDYAMKYSSGMALMYLPFFSVAHLLAAPLGYPADGFSPPYQLGIQVGGFLVSILGLWYLRKLLLLYYKDKTVAVTLAVLVLLSNYLNYAAIDCGMSHCWLFTVYVFLLLNTHYFYQEFKLKYALRIGLLVGLATLTRPTDVISCLIPLLWSVESLSLASVKKQFNKIKANYKPLIAATLCAAAIISIQLIYWKYASGHWIVYSYAGQKLYFRSPNFENYTLSYRSGWLTYSPVMLFAFIGLIPFLKNGRNKVAITSFFLLNYYIVCAWSIWWYGGRAMIQSYPALLFPMASLIDVVLRRRLLIWALTPLALVLLYYNMWLNWQYHRPGVYDTDCMTKNYFWRVVGRWQVPAKTVSLKEDPDLYERPLKDSTLVYSNNFATDTATNFLPKINDSGKTIVLNKSLQNSSIYTFASTGNNFKWLRARATFLSKGGGREWYSMSQFIVRLINKNKSGDARIVKENMVRVQRLLNDNEINNVALDMRLPDQHYDSVSILFWNGDSDKEIQISDLKVYEFNE